MTHYVCILHLKKTNDLLIGHGVLCLCHTFPAGTILMLSRSVYRLYRELHPERGLCLAFLQKAFGLVTGFLYIPGPDYTQSNRVQWERKDQSCCNHQGNLSKMPWSLFWNVRMFLEGREFYLILFSVVLSNQKWRQWLRRKKRGRDVTRR